VSVGLHSCRFFADARRNGALELLLSTPLTVKEILKGQWLTIRRVYLAPVIGVLGLELLPAFSMLAMGLDTSAVPTLVVGGAWFVAGLASFVTDVFAAAWVGMLVGLTAKKPALCKRA
jgi:ABC-type Na+ efflux pump permease subunit